MGEQGLPAWGVCNLGHIRLPAFYNKATNDINWDDLAETIKYAVRYQDNMVDYTSYYLPENEIQQKGERRIGMGTMGLGTLLIRMGIRYGSDEALEFIDKLYKFIALHAYKTGIDLAEEKGSFPFFDYDKYIRSGFAKDNIFPLLPEEYKEKLKQTGIRNITYLTQAPTGSTGTLIDNIEGTDINEISFDNTTGIEPYFAFEYERASRAGTFTQYAKIAKNSVDANGNLPYYFVTAMELTPEEHIKTQAAIQNWTDSSISKTVNMPSSATIDDTRRVYELAYQLGLKGTTIYRDKSREAQVLSTEKGGAKLETEIEEMKKDNVMIKVETKDEASNIKKRPKRLFGLVEKVRYSYGDGMSKAYITITWDDDGHPVEVFIEPTDEREKPMAEALGRSITQFLRFGNTKDNVAQIVKHLKTGQLTYSLPAIIGRLLNDIDIGKIELPVLPSKMGIQKEKKAVKLEVCPNCGEEQYDKVNCICYACNYSKCN